MKPKIGIEQLLRIEELRANFLEHTRKAFALLPAIERPKILDIGCGSGLPTIELARLGVGEVVGIDTDESALGVLNQRIEQAGLSQRVKAVNASLFDTGLPDESFDILWAEGVLHLLEPATSFLACRRLLKPDGFLVMHETIEWFEGNKAQIEALGFSGEAQYLLPKQTWWTDFYAPLEARIHALRDDCLETWDASVLDGFKGQIARVKADPGRFDCGFFVVKKADHPRSPMTIHEPANG